MAEAEAEAEGGVERLLRVVVVVVRLLRAVERPLWAVAGPPSAAEGLHWSRGSEHCQALRKRPGNTSSRSKNG